MTDHWKVGQSFCPTFSSFRRAIPLATRSARPQICGDIWRAVLAYDMGRWFALVSRCVTMLRRFGLVVRCSSEPGIPVCEVSTTRRGRSHLKRARNHLAERIYLLGDELSDVDISILTRVEKSMSRFVSL